MVELPRLRLGLQPNYASWQRRAPRVAVDDFDGSAWCFCTPIPQFGVTLSQSVRVTADRVVDWA
jgi:hypothetical protein